MEYVPRRWLVRYCYDDSSVEPLGSYPVRHALLGTQMPSCPSIWEMHFSLMSVMLLWIRMTEITYLLMHDSTSFDFPDLSHLRCHTRAYFHSRSRFADSHFCSIALSYEMCRVDDSVSFCHDSQMDFSLSRFIGLTLYDIITIFGWSHLRLVDSHIIISSDHMSDLLCIPIELFMSHQDRSGTSDAILGHISFLQLWRRSFCHGSVTVFIIW